MSDNTVRPFIDIAGVRYPFDAGGRVKPLLNYSPTQAFPDAITLGEAARLIDQRTRALVYTDWRGGMGEYQGPNGQLPPQQAFTISDCDTRFERSLILPPAKTQLGASAALGASSAPWHIEYLGSTAKLVAWQRGVTGGRPWYYTVGTNTWTQLPSSRDAPTGFCSFAGNFVFTRKNPNPPSSPIFYSADGVTWTDAMPATGLSFAGCCVFNNLLWIYDETAGYLRAWTGYTIATEVATSSVLQLQPNEQVQQLAVWKNPRNEPALHLLTNQRLLRYDWDLDTAVTPAFVTIHDFTGRVSATVKPRAYVWPRDQLLYVTLGDPSASTGPVDSVLQFSLGASDEVGPNRRGGIPATELFSIGSLVGGYHWLYGFANPRTGAGSPGRVLVMNGLQGWHAIAKGGFAGVNGNITGGGYANGQVWFTTSTGYVYQMDDPDIADLPGNLQSGTRTYPTAVICWHETSWHGGGMENIRKVLQHLDVDARNADVPGVPSNTTVCVQYRLDGSATWINAISGVAGDTTTALLFLDAFPNVIRLAAGLGVRARRMKFRLGLQSGTSTVTPNVAGFEAHFVPKPKEYYAYVARLDLAHGGPSFPNPDSLFGGNNAEQLQAALLAAADGDTLVTVAWGGDDPQAASYTSLGAALIKLGGAQDSDSATGPVTVTIIDLTPPASG